uniref:CMGC/CDK/CDK9 protein kinase n=1 Tax=Mycena chlorophos TaxID=658473 RepID=A0ABQ0LXM7_MYCCL|nr:CMGC/CDK/CDK9 protein kinase [Mycena chlorophos]
MASIKRPASRSPTGEPRPKRQQTSSPPEEGQLDDDQPSLPPKPAGLPPKPLTKIPFPFKKKNQPPPVHNNVFDQYNAPRREDSRRDEPRREEPRRDDDRRREPLRTREPPAGRSPPRRRSRSRSPYNRRYDDRDRPRYNDRPRYDSYRRDDSHRADSYRDRGGDHYRPLSPPSQRYRPLSPRRTPPRQPPQPTISPPPAPPPDPRLNNPLPPKPSSLPPKPAEARPLPPPEPPKDIPRPARRPVAPRRSQYEEERAYGRGFRGCGNASDYLMTTKLGEGTFGEVHKARQQGSNREVALKRILMHNEREGMPVTALREIKILKALNHPCIVNILDMFVVRSTSKDPLSVYMVFPYMDHDLAGLLENERVKLQPSQIKLYMKQLLEGTEYMHRNHILHRDMKAANLLINNQGTLLIADFGLARAFDPAPQKERKYTNCVVTRWYRPPELLLGARQYGGEVDMWGIGCVLGEMFTRRPILPGNSDMDQLEKIFMLCGSPNQHNWPNFDVLPGCDGVKTYGQHTRKIKSTFDQLESETVNLLEALLTCNPRERITAAAALDHDYFWTDPLPADPKTLTPYEPSHEFDKRGQRHMPPQPPQHPPPASIQPPPNRTRPAPEQGRNGPWTSSNYRPPAQPWSGRPQPNSKNPSRAAAHTNASLPARPIAPQGVPSSNSRPRPPPVGDTLNYG